MPGLLMQVDCGTFRALCAG